MATPPSAAIAAVPPPPEIAPPLPVLTEADVDAFGCLAIGPSVLASRNRCQSDDCIRTKILATLRYRTHNVWQAFILDRYLAGAEAAKAADIAAERLVIDYLLLVQWSSPDRWLYTGGDGLRNVRSRPAARSSAGDTNTPLYVLRVELLPARRAERDYLNVVVVYGGPRLVVLPFSPEAAAAALTVPWGSLFGGAQPTSVKVQQSQRPWVSLLWLHAALTRFPRVDVAGSLGQDVAVERATAIFEFHVCDELVPPLRRVRDMERYHLAPFERERVKSLAESPALRELVGPPLPEKPK